MAAFYPDRIQKITRRLREVRGGMLNRTTFFERHTGKGPYAAMLEDLFRVSKRKAGFPEISETPARQTFQRPTPQQASLF